MSISHDYNIRKLSVILESVPSFVLARRQDAGGFAATPHLPVTIEDTYHAINIFNSLHEGSIRLRGPFYDFREDKALLGYLRTRLYQFPGEAKTSFQLVKAASIAGIDVDKDIVKKYVSLCHRGHVSIQRRYYLARMVHEILGLGHVVPRESSRGLLRLGRRTVSEEWMAVYLARVMGQESLMDEGWIAWFRACQNGDGGFGFLPDTTSYIENCHACLRALESLGSAPKDMKGALDFVAGCHTSAGGFARSGRAAPFLDATWHAVASISILLKGLNAG
ncbi:MAG: hypothetical protein M0022_07345 [Desulfobacteraceae bacterium]|nr:hypothetical protein [Desulfobacteraceae bacterium]